jgi:hypothetical protein
VADELLAKPRVAFVQLTKYNVEDGTFEGVMASSSPDQSNEVLDWRSSKPHFQRWFGQSLTRTKGQSLGNVREMHQPIAAGKLTRVKWDDDNERVYVWGKVVNPTTKLKMAEGVLTGLSIGGDYGKKWPDTAHPTLTRYEAKPYEVSLVDNPCNPDAVLTLSSDGTEKMVKFVTAAEELEVATDEDEPLEKQGRPDSAGAYAYAPGPNKSDWKFPIHDRAHVQNAISRFGQDKGIPDAARRKAWGRIMAAARRMGVKVSNSSYTSKLLEGDEPMDPDMIVAEELRKQEAEKALRFEALGKILSRIKKLKKAFRKKDEQCLAFVGGLQKSYVGQVQGWLNDLSGQIASLQSSFTPAVAAGMPQYPGGTQPGETTGGGDGGMVTSTPSSSGTAQMVPGAGQRAGAGLGGKKGFSKKKLAKAFDELEARVNRGVAETLAAILKAPTDAEAARFEAAATKTTTTGTASTAAPVRLMKDAPDAGKVKEGAGATGTSTLPSEEVVKGLQKLAADTSDPVAASRAKAELDRLEREAVAADVSLAKARVPFGEPGFRERKHA